MGTTAPGAPDAPATEAEKSAAELGALMRERSGYVARGLSERVSQVDAEITKRGGKPPPN